MRFLKIYAAGMTALFLAVSLFSAFSLHRCGYDRVILAKLHLVKDPPAYIYRTDTWANSLEQLNVDADVVFYGDSITQFSDFRPYFPDLTIGNLGHSGDLIPHLEKRIDTVKALSPKKLFLMIGINSLAKESPEECIKEYRHLLDFLEKELPDTGIYIESLLPISQKRDRDATLRTEAGVLQINRWLEESARERGLNYIDLYSLYEKDGYLDPAFSSDGLHLLPEAYEPWAEAIRPYLYD